MTLRPDNLLIRVICRIEKDSYLFWYIRALNEDAELCRETEVIGGGQLGELVINKNKSDVT